nr:hypothetical protein [Tanacetum cinerariifolium]
MTIFSISSFANFSSVAKSVLCKVVDDKTEELNLTDGADTKVLVEDKGSGEKGGSTADQVSTARLEVSTATPSTPPTTTTIFGDEDLTIAQTLINLRTPSVKLSSSVLSSTTLHKTDLATEEKLAKDEIENMVIGKENEESYASTIVDSMLNDDVDVDVDS